MNDKTTIISIATDAYILYWKTMIESAESKCEDFQNYEFIVITNQVKEIEEYIYKKKFTNINVFYTDHLPWPLITLLRYKTIHAIMEQFISNIVVYIDVDMLIKQDFLDKIQKLIISEDIYFVPHPGYIKAYFDKNILTKLRNNLCRLFWFNKYGAWEVRKKYNAYVPWRKRSLYFCGGIWFGEYSRVKKFVRECAELTEKDLKENLIPIWHDESYLNKWAAHNHHEVADPGYCYDKRYLEKYNIKPIVEAVVKSNQ